MQTIPICQSKHGRAFVVWTEIIKFAIELRKEIGHINKSVIETHRQLSNSRKIHRDNECDNDVHALAIYFPNVGICITRMRGRLSLIRPVGNARSLIVG